jgi:hypothetical protein
MGMTEFDTISVCKRMLDAKEVNTFHKGKVPSTNV